MRTFLNKYKWPLIISMIGGLGGFLYWRFIGCTSGTCAIKSVWYWSTLWGMAFGYLLGDLLKDYLNRRNEKGKHHEKNTVS
jgi:hypothetical protein